MRNKMSALDIKLQITEATCSAYGYVLNLNGKINLKYFNLKRDILDETFCLQLVVDLHINPFLH
jgi:hypothetical protein